MNFSDALQHIKFNKQVRRSIWDKTKAIYLVENDRNNIHYIEYRNLGSCLMYAASSEDLLADDWVLI